MEKIFFYFFFDVFFFKLTERENRISRRQSNVNLSSFPHHGARNHRPREKADPEPPLDTRQPGIPVQRGSSALMGHTKGQPHHWVPLTLVCSRNSSSWGSVAGRRCLGWECPHMCPQGHGPCAVRWNQRWEGKGDMLWAGPALLCALVLVWDAEFALGSPSSCENLFAKIEARIYFVWDFVGLIYT